MDCVDDLNIRDFVTLTNKFNGEDRIYAGWIFEILDIDLPLVCLRVAWSNYRGEYVGIATDTAVIINIFDYDFKILSRSFTATLSRVKGVAI